MTTIVQCQNINKTYGKKETLVHALNTINMEVKTNELLMIVGPSGSGKTTLLSVISAILSFDSGDCIVCGENLRMMSEKEKTLFRKKYIGFIFQSFHLIPAWTALENAVLPLLIQGIEKNAAYQKGEEFLKRVGLGDQKDSLPSHLSGGEQQRVAICRGCIHEPTLLICDEPTNTLDHAAGMNVVKLIKEIAVKEDKAAIIVTHDHRIFDFADRILEMEDGRILHA